MKRIFFIAGLLSLPLAPQLTRAETPSKEEEKKPAFESGEKLTYSLGWQFIVAGHATVEVLPDEDLEGRKVRSFRLKARTVRVVDPIYKVRDTMFATAEHDARRSLGFRKIQHEGDTHRDETIEFDWDKLEARYSDSIRKKNSTITIPQNTLDPLSAFYFVRNQTFDVGSVIKGPLTDGTECKIAEIKVVRRETIKVNGKTYDTFKLIPDIKEVGGVFKKSKNARIEIWCTADSRHIPVLMKSKVAVGSFRAELVE